MPDNLSLGQSDLLAGQKNLVEQATATKQAIAAGQAEENQQVTLKEAEAATEAREPNLGIRLKDMKKEPVENQSSRIKRIEAAQKIMKPVDNIRDEAKGMLKNNPFLMQLFEESNNVKLEQLLKLVGKCKSKEELQEVLKNFFQPASYETITDKNDKRVEVLRFGDPVSVDDFLNILLEVTEPTPELANIISAVRKEHLQHFGLEIQEKRKIYEEVNTAVTEMVAAGTQQIREGKPPPKTLQEFYQQIREQSWESPAELFNKLFSDYKGVFKNIRAISGYILNQLGMELRVHKESDPNAKTLRFLQGDPQEYARLRDTITTIRQLQSVLGVFRFFKDRENHIQKSFDRNGLSVPPSLTFEQMSKEFVKLIQERYPSGQKVLDSAEKLGPFTESKYGPVGKIIAKIISVNQFRDAVRQVSRTLYDRSPELQVEKQGQLLSAIVDASDNLEEEFDKATDIEPKD